MNPLISIVVGVRNRKKNILTQVNSLEKCKKNFKNFEVVIIDYGGEDKLRGYLKK
jgi:glycosyltransferase involved in cell wall biosynthesis